MNLNNIIFRVKSRLKLYSKISFTETEIIELANGVLDDLSTIVREVDPHYFQTTKIYSMVADTSTYEFPDDFLQQNMFERIDVDPPLEIDYLYPADVDKYINLNLTSSSTYPVVWTWAGKNGNKKDSFQVIPTPSTNLTDWLRLKYERQITYLAKPEDIPEIPPWAHILIPKKIENTIITGQGVNATGLQEEIEKLENRLRNNIYYRQTGTPKRIRGVTTFG